jgi:geranylgeranylglycerol-phosphate geranylgeranyltransferase
MGSVAVGVGALVASGPDLLSFSHLPGAAIAMLVAFLYIGAGNGLNDYNDRMIDCVNHPERPIPAGRIRPESAWKFSMSLWIAGMMLAFFIGWPDRNWLTISLAALNSLLLTAYEKKLKGRGFVGNLTVSWLTASLFLFGGASVMPDPKPTLFPSPVLILALLAFFSSAGREIIKDIEDVRGDRNRRTLPRLIGIRPAGKIAGLWIGMAVVLSPLPVYPLDLFPVFSYLPLVILADVFFILSIWIASRKPGTASMTTKIAMVLALAAFLLGALTVQR